MNHWATPDTPTPAPTPNLAPAPTPPPAPMPTWPVPARRGRTGLPVVLLVLAALVTVALGSAGGWYLAHRPVPADAPAAYAHTLDPTGAAQTAAFQVLHGIGGPDGFRRDDEVADSMAITAHYDYVCEADPCPTDPIPAVVAWDSRVGEGQMDSTRCHGFSCAAQYTRDGYIVQVGMWRSFVDKAYTPDHRLEPDYLLQISVLLG